MGIVHALQISQTPGLTYGAIPSRAMAMLMDKSVLRARSDMAEELLGMMIKMDVPRAAAKYTTNTVDQISSLIDDDNLQISLRALEV